jgi:tetratricopeptide (TPR) repeat protein
MSKPVDRRILIIGGVVVLAALLTIGGIALFSSRGGGETVDAQRANTLLLAADYIDQGEYDRALDLLEDLLIADPQDAQARSLRDQALAAKRAEADASEAAQAARDAAASSSQTASTADPYAAQQAEAEARAREAAAREAEAEARRQEAELALQQQLAAQRAAEEERRRQEELERQRAEEARLAALSEEEAARQRQISDLLSEARRLQQDQEFISARGKINQAIDIDDDSALAYARMAENYVEEDIENNDNLARAINFSEEAIEKDPDLWEPYYTLGRIFNETRQYDKAIRELTTAAELNDTNADIFYALGNAQFDARRYSDARQSYEACVFLDSGNERAYFNLGLTFERLDQADRAIESYRKAVAIKSDYGSAYNRIGELLLNKGDLDNALVNLQQAISLDNTARNNRALARTYYEMGVYSDALEYFLVAVSLESDRAQNQYNVAAVLLDLNRPDEALSYAAEAVRLDNSVPEYNYTLGLAIKQLGSNDQARGYFRTAIQQRSSYIKPRIELADIMIQEQNYDEALQTLLDAYRIDSSRADVNNNLATVYRLKNLTEDSLRHSAAAIQAEPNSALLRYNLALTLISMESYAEAESSLETAINLDGRYWDAYLRLGEVLIAEDKKDEAKTVLENLVSRGSGTDQARRATEMLGSL